MASTPFFLHPSRLEGLAVRRPLISDLAASESELGTEYLPASTNPGISELSGEVNGNFLFYIKINVCILAREEKEKKERKRREKEKGREREGEREKSEREREKMKEREKKRQKKDRNKYPVSIS